MFPLRKDTGVSESFGHLYYHVFLDQCHTIVLEICVLYIYTLNPLINELIVGSGCPWISVIEEYPFVCKKS